MLFDDFHVQGSAVRRRTALAPVARVIATERNQEVLAHALNRASSTGDQQPQAITDLFSVIGQIAHPLDQLIPEHYR